MNEHIEALASEVKGILLGRLDKFLDANVDKKVFLQERTTRLAELATELLTAKTGDERRYILERIDSVRDTIRNELYAAAVNVSTEFKNSVDDVLAVTVDWGLKLAPILLRLVAAKIG